MPLYIYISSYVHLFVLYSVCLFRYNIEQEQKLALETTVLVEQYTVSEQEVNVVSALLDDSIKII